ncbi:MAG: long-chain fatty acid--CoA ligase [Bacillota bacterium]
MTVVKGRDLGEVKRETINDLFWATVERHPEIVAARFRAGDGFSECTYRQLGQQVKELGAGLLALGLQKGDKVSLLAETRYEWVVADFAILTAAGVTVTVYPTLSARTVQFIVDNSDSEIIFVENRLQLDKVISIWDQLPALKQIIVIEPLESKPRQNILTMQETMELGRRFAAAQPAAYEAARRSVDPADLSSIVYTSGTTGLPKGTMLSHWNWRFNVYAVVDLVDFQPGDTLLAFLPLAHVYMRLVYFAAVYAAATTHFSYPDTLAQDLPLVRPHCFVSVPRLFERVYNRLLEQMGGGPALRKKIFFWAAAVAREMGETLSLWQEPGFGLKLKHRIADKLVYSKIRVRMGVDRLKWTCSSGSALRKDLAFFFNGMGITIIEGYGMTEVAAPSNLNPVGRFKPGTVGPPLAGVMQQIAADGEILIKGDNVMIGYYKLPEETKEHFTEDGWLKTGDIGEFDEDGYLIFKERKKNILVLSTGKNVAPLPIEEALKKSRWVDEAVVIGDNEKFVAALIQPNYQSLLNLAREYGLQYDEAKINMIETATGEKVPVQVDRRLLEDEKVLEIFRQVVERAGRSFDPYEQVKKFQLLDQALTLEEDELTPTLKVKKDVIQKKYENLIRQIYAGAE